MTNLVTYSNTEGTERGWRSLLWGYLTGGCEDGSSSVCT